MDSELKRKKLEERIKNIESGLRRAYEYLEDGSHSHWHGFRPYFKPKIKNGVEQPPHKDWVKNVFIPAREKAIRKAEDLLDRLN